MAKTQINLTDSFIAICYRGNWEIYEVDGNGLEIFSHRATPGEIWQITGLLMTAYSTPRGFDN